MVSVFVGRFFYARKCAVPSDVAWQRGTNMTGHWY